MRRLHQTCRFPCQRCRLLGTRGVPTASSAARRLPLSETAPAHSPPRPPSLRHARNTRLLPPPAEDAEGADAAIIYYSGHGIEAGGENWFVPVDADLGALEDVEKNLVPLSGILDELRAKVPLTIFLIDACRSNPFPAGTVARKPVSYTHLRAHETVLDLVCRLLLEKKKQTYT